MTDFDPNNQQELEPSEQTASEKPLTWYERNRDRICEKQRENYAANKDGMRDKHAVRGKAYYEQNKERLRPQTEEAIAKKKARQKRWYEENKERQCRKERARYKEVKDRDTSSRLKKKFGITLEDYNAMLALQGGRCAVCGTDKKIKDKHGNLRRLAVDHDHKTGKVRQLLCSPCNTSIGLVKENVKTLLNMIDYIKKHGETNVNTVTLTLTLDELQAVVGLIDAGIKSVGLSGVKSAAAILIKLEAAVAEANKSEPQEAE